MIACPIRLFCILLVLLAIVPPGPAAAEGRFDHGVLWRVDAPGVAPSYLFGTLHSSDERVLALAPAVRKALDGSRSMAIELVSDEASARRFRQAMVSREPLLPGLLGEETYARVAALLGEAGIPAKARPHFKAWAALLVLVQPRGIHGIRLDNLLLMEGRSKDWPIHQLETVDEQIAAFTDLPADTQLALLRHAEGRQDEIQAAVRPMVEAYLARDLAAMWRVNAEAMGDDPAIAPHNQRFLASVLDRRNERFAQRLAPLLRAGRVFAVFGALHLYGEHGVPAQLARQGFRVRRVH